MANTVVSYPVSEELNLISVTIPKEKEGKEPVVVAPPKVNHIFAIDCSGSMYGSLDRLRQELKNKIATSIAENDTLSIIWFSGRGQFGTVVEAYSMKSATSLQQVNAAIDRYLTTVGLTGFKEPMEEASRLVDRIISTLGSDNVFSLSFMTDGGDNEWAVDQILKATEEAAMKMATFTIVEYGWYCNRPLLTKMAEAAGGNLIFAEKFQDYVPIIEAEFTNQPSAAMAKRIEVEIPTESIGKVAYTITDDAVVAYAVVDGKVAVPSTTKTVWFLSTVQSGRKKESAADIFAKKFEEGKRTTSAVIPGLYAGMFVLAQRMMSNEGYGFLRAIGDVRLIKMFANCFGKQHYTSFQAEVLKCVFNNSERMKEGYDPTMVPAEDAYTVVQLLDDLIKDEDAKLILSEKFFENYSRISRATEDAMELLSEEEKAEVAARSAKARNAKDIKAVNDYIDGLLETKQAAKFVEGDAGDVPFHAIVLNSTRPNVSIRVERKGTVKLPKNDLGLTEVESKVYRNYNIIRDGIINTKTLPVSFSKATFDKLVAEKILDESIDWEAGKVFELNLMDIPLINRKMVGEVSAVDTARSQYDLYLKKCGQAVFNYFYDQKFARAKSAGLVEKYSAEQVAYLIEMGVTDAGFNPKRAVSPSTDQYTTKELSVELKGLKSLPKTADVIAKIDAGKALTGREKGFVAPYKEYTEFMATEEAKDEAKLREWLDAKRKEFINGVRALQGLMARVSYTIVVGQTWFKEFSSLDENTVTIQADGEDVLATFNLGEEIVKV
jgi:hypothetical protein